MSDQTHRELPPDFAGRLRAAHHYSGITSRKAFAAKLNVDGASEATIKNYETGKGRPGTLAAPNFVARVAEVSGLPEAFLWGDTASASVGDVAHSRLNSIESEIRAIRLALAARDSEALRRLESIQAAIGRLQARRQR